MEGIKKYKLPVVKTVTGNIVNNIGIALNSVRWVLNS